MAENSNISWCDSTFSPWIGCTKVSAGCAACYAEEMDRTKFSKTLGGGTKEKPIQHWGKGAPRYRTSVEAWKKPLRWNKNTGRKFDSWDTFRDVLGTTDAKLIESGNEPFRRPRVFFSLGDPFDDEVPIEWLADFLKLIHDTPNLDWQLLSKRPQNFFPRLTSVLNLYEQPATREHGLQSDSRRGISDHGGWGNLATEEAIGGQVEGRDKDSDVSTSQGGSAKRLRIPTSPRDVELKENPLGGAQASLETFQRSNSAGINDQSQERKKDGQQTGKSGVGYDERAEISRLPSAQLRAEQAQRGTQSEASSNRDDGGRNSEETRFGREGTSVSNRVRNDEASSVGDLPSSNLEASAVVQWLKAWLSGTPPPNAWLGVSCENQEMADKRIPELLKIPAKVRFLSCEPLLSEIDLRFPSGASVENQKFPEGFSAWSEADKDQWFMGVARGTYIARTTIGIDQVIAGGESGPKRREMNLEWMTSLYEQCKSAGVPFFCKQTSALRPGQQGLIPDDIFNTKEFPNL